jgi:hypothetical protein
MAVPTQVGVGERVVALSHAPSLGLAMNSLSQFGTKTREDATHEPYEFIFLRRKNQFRYVDLTEPKTVRSPA